MDTNKSVIAAAERVLIFPAGLFLTAVVACHLQPLRYEPAHTAQIVMWYSVRYWTLWVLLIALPFAALFTGCVTLLHHANNWTEHRQAARRLSIGTHLPMRIIAAATLAAGLVLVVVALHMLAN